MPKIAKDWKVMVLDLGIHFVSLSLSQLGLPLFLGRARTGARVMVIERKYVII